MCTEVPPAAEKYLLRLYVASNTPQSAAALRNLRQLCEEHLAGRYHLEVIDLAKHPQLAKRDQIVAVPTLVRKLPNPIRKFIGTLSNPDRVLLDFDLLPRDHVPAADGEGAVHAS
jgi:circadian clock protein KaiB